MRTFNIAIGLRAHLATAILPLVGCASGVPGQAPPRGEVDGPVELREVVTKLSDGCRTFYLIG